MARQNGSRPPAARGGADPTTEYLGESVLCRGAYKADVVDLILELGLTDRIEDSCDFLARYAEFGSAEGVQSLIQAGFEVEGKDPAGRTPLVRAWKRKNYAVARVLLEAGADPEARWFGWPLIVSSDSYQTCLLLQHGADVNAVNEQGFTALMMAAEVGDPALAELLLESGANPDLQDAQGRTALMFALSGDLQLQHSRISAERRAWVAPVLIEAGADLTLKDNRGRSALDYARRHGLEGMVDLLRESEGPMRF